MKTCTICEEEKIETKFPQNGKGKRRRANCKQCKNKKQKRRARNMSFEQFIRDHATRISTRHRIRSLRYSSRDVGFLENPDESLIRIWKEQEGKCKHCNCELELTPGVMREKNPNAGSVDRIDSSNTYCEGNIVWTCAYCNKSRMAFGRDVCDKKLIEQVNQLLKAGKYVYDPDRKKIFSYK